MSMSHAAEQPDTLLTLSSGGMVYTFRSIGGQEVA